MLILFQDGETAVVLTEPFKIEIDRIYDDPMLERYHKGASTIIKWNVFLLQNDTVEILGTYDTLEDAKQTIMQFTKAYERGDLAFRVK